MGTNQGSLSPMIRSIATALMGVVSCIAAPAFAGIEFRAALAEQAVHTDRDLHLTVEASWLEEPGVDYRILTPKLTALKNLEVVRQLSPSGETAAQGDHVRQRRMFDFILRPKEFGPASTGEIEVPYYRIQPQSTDAGESKDSGKPAKPEQLTHRIGTIDVTVTKPPGLGLTEKLVIAGAGVVALVILAFWFVDWRMGKRAATDADRPPDDALEEKHLNRLRDLRALRLDGDIKGYCGKLADTLDSYLRRKFADETPDSDRAVRDDVISVCEAVRFAGHSPPPSELDRITTKTTELIAAYLPSKTAPDPTEDIKWRT